MDVYMDEEFEYVMDENDSDSSNEMNDDNDSM